MKARSDPGVPYVLKAPMSDAWSLGGRVSLLLWGVGSLILGTVTSILLVYGEFRYILLVLLGFLALACLDLRRGVYILLTFLPFMYFLRRQVLHFQSFDARDPILLFPAVTTVLMFMSVLIFYGPLIYRYLRQSSLFKACVLLMVVFLLQIFNPLQGNILIGFAGGLYYIVPLAWCVLGLLMKDEDISKIFRLILFLGFITAMYGLYQHFFGLSAVELYELDSKGMLKGFGDQIRITSTFSTLGDFSLYMSICGILTFSYYWNSKGRLHLALFLIIITYTMIWTAVRSAFLMMFFGIVMLLVINTKRMNRLWFRGMAALTCVLSGYAFLYRYDPERMYDVEFSENPAVVYTFSGITHPTQESTFQSRMRNWTSITVNAFTYYPMGHGLGTTTPAARKFGGGREHTTDSYFFGLMYGSGLVAAILFIVILWLGLRSILRLCLAKPGIYLYKICFAFLAAMCLANVFGGPAGDLISGPLFWLVIGWVARQHQDMWGQKRMEPAG